MFYLICDVTLIVYNEIATYSTYVVILCLQV